MKTPVHLSVTAAHHDDKIHPLVDEQAGADERLAHSRHLTERLIAYHDPAYCDVVTTLEHCGHDAYCGSAACQECGVATQRFFAELVERKWPGSAKLKVCTVVINELRAEVGSLCFPKLDLHGGAYDLYETLAQLKLPRTGLLGCAELCLIRSKRQEYWALLHHFFAEDTLADRVVAKLREALLPPPGLPSSAWTIEVDDRRRQAYRMAKPMPPRVIECRPKLVSALEPMEERQYIEALQWAASYKTTDRIFGHGAATIDAVVTSLWVD
jgi:hypothetical protein